MSRSPLKQMAGVTIGAIAMFAMAVPAMTEEDDAEAFKKDEVFTLTAIYQAPGVGPLFSFDISWFDPVLDKNFLADRNHKAIDVIDPTNHSITQFVNPAYAGFTGNNDTSGPDGVLTVNNSELWVGDSNTCTTPPCLGTTPANTPGSGRVWVLDAKSGANLSGSPILVGGHTRADELCFDPRNHLIMIASPGEDPPYVTFISTTTRKIVSKLVFDGTGGTPKATNGLEQCEWSPKTGKFYQNVPEINGPGNDTKPGGVSVIDPISMKVEKTFPVPIDDCAGPQGMAIGPHNQILLGCNAKSPNGHRNTAVINTESGAVLRVFPDLGGDDAVTFNPGDDHYFIPSCNTACRTVGNPTGTEVLGVVDANGLRLDQSVKIASQNSDTTVTSGNPRTIHSVSADPNRNQAYLAIPAAPGGNVPHFAPTLCDSRGTGITIIGSPSTATGCIAVFATTNDDRSRVADERGKDDHQE